MRTMRKLPIASAWNARNSLKSLVLAAAFAGVAHGQGVLLTPGDAWTCRFTTLEYISSQNAPFGPPTIGGEILISYATTNEANLKLEYYEDATPGGLFSTSPWGMPSLSGTNTLTILFDRGPWQDFEGAIRFTGLDGSLLLDSVRFTLFQYIAGDQPRVDTFQTIVTPVPEPSSSVLLVAAFFLFACTRMRRVWNQN